MNARIGQHIIPVLKNGGIGVLPTDTIYGIVGSATNAKTVTRIYKARHRNPKKPMIILVSTPADLLRFGIVLNPKIKKILKQVWPGPVSVVFKITKLGARKKFAYLHRGTKTLAFRVPKPPWLRALLVKTGPLVAPSANIEGMRPARTIKEAKKYFDDTVDFYLDVGPVVGKPSKLIRVENDMPIILRA